ncbi:MAG: exodeoxyribonuclease VII small subunit [Oleiphilaceae bacterium]|nr:exodeoxyribonuclease VII small subunit [Oleiphilaceae bacterium]
MSEKANNDLQQFEHSLAQLEDIVRKMEQGQLTLEESLGAFEQGVKLTRQCQETLKNAEQRVSQLRIEGDQLIASSQSTDVAPE